MGFIGETKQTKQTKQTKENKAKRMKQLRPVSYSHSEPTTCKRARYATFRVQENTFETGCFFPFSLPLIPPGFNQPRQKPLIARVWRKCATPALRTETKVGKRN